MCKFLRISVLALFVILSACTPPKKEFNMPRIKTPDALYGLEDMNRKGVVDAHYLFLYTGITAIPEINPDYDLSFSLEACKQSSDTTIRYEKINLHKNPDDPNDYEVEEITKEISLLLPSDATLDIYVDTTQQIFSYATKWFDDDDDVIYLHRAYNCIAYPVAIVNTTSDTLSVWINKEKLPLLMEAKDKYGKWKPIEENYDRREPEYGWRYTTEWYYPLPPDEMILTSVPVLSGVVQTRLRLCYKDGDIRIYSNEFKGWVNPEQFETEN